MISSIPVYGQCTSTRRSAQSIGLRFEACVFLLDCWMEGLLSTAIRRLAPYQVN